MELPEILFPHVGLSSVFLKYYDIHFFQSSTSMKASVPSRSLMSSLSNVTDLQIQFTKLGYSSMKRLVILPVSNQGH